MSCMIDASIPARWTKPPGRAAFSAAEAAVPGARRGSRQRRYRLAADIAVSRSVSVASPKPQPAARLRRGRFQEDADAGRPAGGVDDGQPREAGAVRRPLAG